MARLESVARLCRRDPGEVILLPVGWHVRYLLVYEHVAELRAQCGIAVAAHRIRHWVEVYAPESNKR